MRGAVAVLGVLLLVMLAACPAAARTPTPQEVFRQVAPSVVVVEVWGIPKTGKPKLITSGSGVVIPGRSKDENLVATNCHVVDQSPDGHVFFQQGNNRALGRVENRDADRDLCLVRSILFNGKDDHTLQKLPAVQVGSSQWLEVGDTVYAIGAPQGLELSLSSGLVSGFRQHKGNEYIQITAPISKGSSGGGLFDVQGRLVGITTMYVKDGQALNFAVPAELVASVPEIKPAMPQIARASKHMPEFRLAPTSPNDRWQTFYIADSRALDVDMQTVVIADDDIDPQRQQTVAWVRHRFSSQQDDGDGINYIEDVRRYTFWCNSSSYFISHIIQRDINREIVFSHKYSVSEIKVLYIIPDTIGEAIRDKVCSL